METDFLDAHARHWEDAEALFNSRRRANADHLYGIAAECGLKNLMNAFGMPVDPSGRPTGRQDRVHANEIWKRYETYRSGHHRGASYALPSVDPFSDWDINQRYAHQNKFDEGRVAPHRRGAETVRQLIDKARKEGLV